MILTQEYILAQLKEHPNGCSVPELIDMSCHPFTDRSVVVKNYTDKLRKMFRRGEVTRTGQGGPRDPFIWRVADE